MLNPLRGSTTTRCVNFLAIGSEAEIYPRQDAAATLVTTILSEDHKYALGTWNWQVSFCSRWFLIIILFFLVSTLLTKQKRSQIGLDSTEPAFNQLTKLCLKRNLPVKAWRSAEHLAMEERGEHLKIFDVNHKKAPTLAEITLALTNTKDDSNNTVDIVDWIADGIKAQNDQWVLNLISDLVFS